MMQQLKHRKTRKLCDGN